MIQVEQINGVWKFRLARSILNRGFYFTAAYWVDGMMVDTGCAHTVRELVAALRGYKIDRIVNTHSHEDHIAGNTELHKLYGAPVLAHPAALPVIADPRGMNRLRPYQKILWGYPDPSRAKAIGDRVETPGHGFEVIHTPGHSPDHLCLYEPNEGWLFSGDLFVGGRDRALRSDYNIWLIIASLKVIEALDISLLFPGSGSVRRNPHNEISQKIRYLEELGDNVLELHNKGWSYSRIRRKLFGPEPPVAYYTLGHFSGAHLIRSYIEDRPL